jgi:hypothetical protein
MEWFLGKTAEEMRIAKAAFAIPCPRCHVDGTAVRVTDAD